MSFNKIQRMGEEQKQQQTTTKAIVIARYAIIYICEASNHNESVLTLPFLPSKITNKIKNDLHSRAKRQMVYRVRGLVQHILKVFSEHPLLTSNWLHLGA